MRFTMFATISANGFIADCNGEEDIFDEKNWELFVNYSRKYGNIIWGRKTYEMVTSWGNEYIDCFDSIKIIVISKNKINYKKENIVVVNSIDECINYLEKEKIDNPFIGGGSTIYSLFAKKDLLNKIILSYNSIFFMNGVPLFNCNLNLNNFKIYKTEKISDKILSIEMNRNFWKL